MSVFIQINDDAKFSIENLVQQLCPTIMTSVPRSVSVSVAMMLSIDTVWECSDRHVIVIQWIDIWNWKKLLIVLLKEPERSYWPIKQYLCVSTVLFLLPLVWNRSSLQARMIILHEIINSLLLKPFYWRKYLISLQTKECIRYRKWCPKIQYMSFCMSVHYCNVM